MRYILKYKLAIFGSVIGGVAGFVYYYFVGCASGTCAITSNPYISTGYGSLMGILLFTNFKSEQTSKQKIENEN